MRTIVAIVTGFLAVAGVLFYVSAPTASAVNLVDTSCSSVTGKGNLCGAKADDAKVMVSKVVNLLLYVLGVIAVIVIIVGGIKFTTSDGDAGKIKGARETILYAVVGLVVAILAWSIVNFVVLKIQ